MKYLSLAVLLLLFGCNSNPSDPLASTLQSSHPAIINVMYKPAKYEVQIIYTQIDKNELGETVFSDFSFGQTDVNYFYPASTVKLPAAILALEFLESKSQISPQSKYTIDRDSLTHFVADDIRQIFAVSDNEAYNRLYELMGRDYINRALREKGISGIRISHRLSTANAAYAQRDSLFFATSEGSIGLGGTRDTIIEKLDLTRQQKGKGFMRNDSLIESPMDFSEKNYFSIGSQHEMMKRIFYPEYFSASERFQLSEANRNLLIKAMHTVPRNNGYNEDEYYDSYGKFFIYGDTKEQIPTHVKIYNKVGYAYGTLTETAYIVDEERDIQFLLTATILVNSNRVFNDDNYEYDAIGIPFLAQLGRELYLYEYARKK